MDLNCNIDFYSPRYYRWLNVANVDVHKLCSDHCAYALTQNFNARKCTLLLKKVSRLATMVRHWAFRSAQRVIRFQKLRAKTNFISCAALSLWLQSTFRRKHGSRVFCFSNNFGDSFSLYIEGLHNQIHKLQTLWKTHSWEAFTQMSKLHATFLLRVHSWVLHLCGLVAFSAGFYRVLSHTLFLHFCRASNYDFRSYCLHYHPIFMQGPMDPWLLHKGHFTRVSNTGA